MSELINKNDDRATIRWKLLTSVSALVLTAYVSPAGLAHAEDSDRPQVWIELGGQLSRLQDGQEPYAPSFVNLTPPDFTPPQKSERPPLYGIDETGKISFQPENSDWIFSASIRYGRSGSGKHVRHQSNPAPYTLHSTFYGTQNGVYFHNSGSYLKNAIAARFTDVTAKESESHAIVDLQVGKDVGLGLFGDDTSSTLSIGVRIAQFRSRSRALLQEDPDWQFKTHVRDFHFSRYTDYYGVISYFKRHILQQKAYQPYHSFDGTFRADRSFSGVGPSISWTSSVPFAGNSQDGALAIDWGVNAALLFGRQKTKTHQQTSTRYHPPQYTFFANPGTHTTTYNPPVSHTRSRRVTVPNIGGFAGISFNYSDAKLSFGYRGDFFFGAIDGGIDTAKKENRAFFGPYASISIGMGD